MRKGLTVKAIFLFFVAGLSWCILDGVTLYSPTPWAAPSTIAEEKRSEEKGNGPGTAPAGSEKTESESPPEKDSPLKDFVPTEKIEPDKAVDFPVDI